jgi:hypothetical protein
MPIDAANLTGPARQTALQFLNARPYRHQRAGIDYADFVYPQERFPVALVISC